MMKCFEKENALMFETVNINFHFLTHKLVEYLNAHIINKTIK